MFLLSLSRPNRTVFWYQNERRSDEHKSRHASRTTQAYIAEHITKGDLVHVRGRLRQSRYERNCSRVYTVDLVASSFSRLAQGSDRVKASERAREAQPA